MTKTAGPQEPLAVIPSAGAAAPEDPCCSPAVEGGGIGDDRADPQALDVPTIWSLQRSELRLDQRTGTWNRGRHVRSLPFA
jgi:hypothetical protein